jgi:hypothetical protein
VFNFTVHVFKVVSSFKLRSSLHLQSNQESLDVIFILTKKLEKSSLTQPSTHIKRGRKVTITPRLGHSQGDLNGLGLELEEGEDFFSKTHPSIKKTITSGKKNPYFIRFIFSSEQRRTRNAFNLRPEPDLC